jgi:hypothetical protein
MTAHLPAVTSGLAQLPEPPSHVRIVGAPAALAAGRAESPDWVVVDANGCQQGGSGSRGGAVRLMSRLASRAHEALPLQVVDPYGHLTGDRLA